MNINLNKLDIAIEIGFNILSHFNKQFKLITGMPSKEYRLRLKELDR